MSYWLTKYRGKVELLSVFVSHQEEDPEAGNSSTQLVTGICSIFGAAWNTGPNSNHTVHYSSSEIKALPSECSKPPQLAVIRLGWFRLYLALYLLALKPFYLKVVNQ